MSNKEKPVLRKLIRAKNCEVVISDTDKNMCAANADKKDVIFECIRQLHNIKTNLKLMDKKGKH